MIKTYIEWEGEYLERFRKDYPNSAAPRSHVLSKLYDEYIFNYQYELALNTGKTYLTTGNKKVFY